MPESFTSLLRQHEEAIARAWADRIYADSRTDLPAILSYRQLVEPLPGIFDELGRVLDRDDVRVEEAALRQRSHAQVRFQQGVLIDEVARELMTLRAVLAEFFWEEGTRAAGGSLRSLREALRRADLFLDELIVQSLLVYAACSRPRVRTRNAVRPTPRPAGGPTDEDEY